MSVDDRLINIRVDQLLVRRGIDTSKLAYSAAKGVVSINGFLKGRSRSAEIKSSADVKQLDMQMRRIPNVKSVTWNLANWRKEGTNWKKILAAREGGQEG